MKTQTEGNQIIAFPDENITSNNALAVEQELCQIAASEPDKELVIDASLIEYVSSAGLRIFLGLTNSIEGKLTIRNVSPSLYEIFDITGFTELLNVEKKMRELSVDGCEVIGQGAFGTVYRLDEDTIIKVYPSKESLPMIKRERELSRQAFIRGVPTAISFDIVKVGDGYGSVFELLKANLMNDVLKENPEKIDDLVKDFVNLMRSIHNVEVEPGELPSASKKYLKCLDDLSDVIPEDVSSGMRKLLEDIPEDNHVVHGDFHMKNIMISDGQPLVIDLETVCCGDPIFDLQGLYVTYVAYLEAEEDNSVKFLGIPATISRSVFEKSVDYYFEDLSEEEREQCLNRIKLLGNLRFLECIVLNGSTSPDLKDVRIKQAVTHMRELLPKVDHLWVRR